MNFSDTDMLDAAEVTASKEMLDKVGSRYSLIWISFVYFYFFFGELAFAYYEWGILHNEELKKPSAALVDLPIFWHLVFMLVSLLAFFLIAQAMAAKERTRLLALRQSFDVSMQKFMQGRLVGGKAREYFTREVTHELKTPLQLILISSDLLDHVIQNPHEPDAKEDALDSIKRIRESVEQIQRQLEDLKGFTGDGGLSLLVSEFKVQDLVKKSSDSFKNTAKKKNLEFSVEVDEQTAKAEICSDLLRLQQIISNLIHNSIKYTENGFVKVAFKIKNGNVHVIVTDTGVGIPSDELNLVREPFIRGSNVSSISGSGIGLAIVTKLLNKLGGKLILAPNPSGGTVAEAIFPRSLK